MLVDDQMAKDLREAGAFLGHPQTCPECGLAFWSLTPHEDECEKPGADG